MSMIKWRPSRPVACSGRFRRVAVGTIAVLLVVGMSGCEVGDVTSTDSSPKVEDSGNEVKNADLGAEVGRAKWTVESADGYSAEIELVMHELRRVERLPSVCLQRGKVPGWILGGPHDLAFKLMAITVTTRDTSPDGFTGKFTVGPNFKWVYHHTAPSGPFNKPHGKPLICLNDFGYAEHPPPGSTNDLTLALKAGQSTTVYHWAASEKTPNAPEGFAAKDFAGRPFLRIENTVGRGNWSSCMDEASGALKKDDLLTFESCGRVETEQMDWSGE